MVDQTEPQANTNGSFELKMKVTSTCGNLPAPNHPVGWSWTIDGVNYVDTTYTNSDGIATLNWTIPPPRINRFFSIVTACAENNLCRTITIDEDRVGLRVQMGGYSTTKCDSNIAVVTGNLSLSLIHI